MAPPRGWRPRGQWLEARGPHGHWKTLTCIAHDRIDAPWVIDGSIDGGIFTAYVKQVLLPALAKGDAVILDNLGSHKGKAARKVIRDAGAEQSASHLPARLLPRPQSDRAGLRKAQASHPKRLAPNRRSHLEKGRRSPRTC